MWKILTNSVSIPNCYYCNLQAQYCLFCVSIYSAFAPVMQCQKGLRNARGGGPEKAGIHSPFLLNLYTPTSPAVIKDKSELSKHLLNHAKGGRWFMLSWVLSLNSTQFPCSCRWIASSVSPRCTHQHGKPGTACILSVCRMYALPSDYSFHLRYPENST